MDNWHEKKLPFQGIEPQTSQYLKIERSLVRIPPGDSIRQFYIIILQPFEEYHFPYMKLGLCRKLLRMTHTTSQKNRKRGRFLAVSVALFKLGHKRGV